MREEDYHKRIGEKIKAAIDSEEGKDYPLLHGMFSEEIPFPDELTEKKMKKEGKKRHHRFLKAASFVLAVFCCSCVIAVYMSEYGTVQAVKFRIDQFIWSMDGDLVTFHESEDGSGISEMTIEITDEEDLDKAKDFLKELYLPTYLPEGFRFESLNIIKSIEGTYFASYVYKNEKEQGLHIFQEYTEQIGDGLLMLEGIYGQKESNKGTVYFSYESVFDTTNGTMINGHDLIDVGGAIQEEEIFKIMEGMNQ